VQFTRGKPSGLLPGLTARALSSQQELGEAGLAKSKWPASEAGGVVEVATDAQLLAAPWCCNERNVKRPNKAKPSSLEQSLFNSGLGVLVNKLFDRR
jgi:hypothetical protein